MYSSLVNRTFYNLHIIVHLQWKTAPNRLGGRTGWINLEIAGAAVLDAANLLGPEVAEVASQLQSQLCHGAKSPQHCKAKGRLQR